MWQIIAVKLYISYLNTTMLLLKPKKGLMYQAAVVIVLTLLAILVIFLYYKHISSSTNKLIEKEQCKNSVRAAAAVKTIPGQGMVDSFGNPVKLNCETHYIKVDKGREFEIIAEEMATCYDEFLEGKQEIFDTKDGNYCVVCSVMDFKQKKVFYGFTDYLMTHKVPWKNQSYFEYLSRRSVTGGAESVDIPGELDRIDTHNRLAVVFFMSKDAFPDGLVESDKLTTTTVGSAGGLVSGLVGGTLVLIGTGSCASIVGCAWGGALIGIGVGIAGGATGYMIGASDSATWDSGVLLVDYKNFLEDKRLNCTYLEGKPGKYKIIS